MKSSSIVNDDENEFNENNKEKLQDTDNFTHCFELSGIENCKELITKENSNDIMICMLCLGDTNDVNDELIECDGCGIVVHEGVCVL